MDTAGQLPPDHWLLELLNAPGADKTRDIVEPDDLDRPSDLKAADTLVARWPRPEHGSRDNTGHKLCAQLFDLGLSHIERHTRLSELNQELP